MHKKYPLKELGLIIIFTYIAVFSNSCTNDNRIKIGASLEISGKSNLGVAARNGMEVAVHEINEKGINGRQIQLIVKDNKGTNEETERVDKELLSQNIQIIVGHLLSNCAETGLKTIAGTDTLMISPAAAVEALANIDDNFIRLMPSSKVQGYMLGQKAYDELKGAPVSLVYEDTNITYAKEIATYFKEKYTSLGGRIAFERSYTSMPFMSYRDVANDVVNSNSSAVILAGPAIDSALFCQEINKKKVGIRFYMGDWAMTDDFIANGGKSVEGCTFVGGYDKENNKKSFESFRKKYILRYNEEPTYSSVYSYEALKMLQVAMDKSSAYDGKSVKKRILEIKSFSGLQDDFSINNFGDVQRELIFFRVKDGMFKRES